MARSKRRVAMAAAGALALALPGCAVMQVASDLGDIARNTSTTADNIDFINRNNELKKFYEQSAAGDWEAALATIRGQIENPVDDNNFPTAISWNADRRAEGLFTLKRYTENVGCNPAFPSIAQIWFDGGVLYAEDVAPQTVKRLTVEKDEFDAVYAEKCGG